MERYFDKTLFSEKIKERRAKLGLGVRGAAKQINSSEKISAATISRIERGFDTGIETVMSICNWLGVSINSFVKVRKPKNISFTNGVFHTNDKGIIKSLRNHSANVDNKKRK